MESISIAFHHHTILSPLKKSQQFQRVQFSPVASASAAGAAANCHSESLLAVSGMSMQSRQLHKLPQYKRKLKLSPQLRQSCSYTTPWVGASKSSGRGKIKGRTSACMCAVSPSMTGQSCCPTSIKLVSDGMKHTSCQMSI